MRRNLIATALIASAALLMPAQAHAATLYGLTLTSPACNVLVPTTTFNYTSCIGSFAGNDKNQDVTAALASFAPGLTYKGASDEANNGPFSNGSSANAGTLTFDSPVSGPFVLVLKAGDQFSMYYFANAGGTSSLTFSTTGTNVNANNIANGLSHASLYGGQMGVVPEPSTYALMATGLIGLGAAARRRRNA